LEILELIGRGGMGAVYKARQKQLDRVVALKILPPGTGHDAAFAERFAREAKALAKLNHPNIVTLYEFGETGGQFYFLMEFVDGVNLRQLLHAGRISPREALAIVPQICDALQFAHDQGIVHRDIKPENILLDRRGRVKVADFGLAKIVGAERNAGFQRGAKGAEDTNEPGRRPALQEFTDAGRVMGTPQYMSPEQIAAPGEVDHRADIYALGVVFYQMLTGELPGKIIEPPSSKVQIDVRLDEVVLRALEKNPELRYQQVSEVKTMVETIVATPPGSSRREEAQTEKSEIGKQKAETSQSLVTSAATNQVARFSRTAIVGACWLAFVPLHFLISLLIPTHNWFFDIIAFLQALLFWTAPVGATILGWVAVSQIRHSAGKLYGMWLAVFDGLLFPLLTVDGLIVGTFYLGLLLADQELKRSLATPIGIPFLLLIPIVFGVVALADFFIIRRVWRAVNKPVAAPMPPVQKPDRFWRWFAVAVFAMIAIPFLISIFGLLAAIAIPNFVKARARAQANAQHTAAQIATNQPAEQNLSFGPVMERVISLAAAGTNYLIGFKTGALRTPPPEISGSIQEIYQWGLGEQMDAAAGIIGSNVLTGFDLVTVIAPAQCWEELTPAQAARRLELEPRVSFTTISYGNGSALPETCVFKTREGGIGILQVTDLVSNPPGLKVRYKFLDKLPAAMQPDSNATNAEWSPVLLPGDKPDVQKIRDEVKTLMDQGRYEEALQRQIWYFNHAAKYGESDSIRLTFGIMNWAELGRRYPKAKQALTEIRDRDAREFAESRGYSALFSEIQSLNRALQDDDATLALFKTLPQKDKQLAGQCYGYVEDLLMQKGEYELCLNCLGDPQMCFESARRGFESLIESQQRMAEIRKQYPVPAPQFAGAFRPPDMGQLATNNFVGQVCKLVEILVATGHKADAEKIRDEAVTVLDDPRLQSAVSDAEQKIKK
jgi:serine/threonine protein kinase